MSEAEARARIRWIAARALPLDARLRARRSEGSLECADGPERAAAILARWRVVIGEEGLSRRLAWAGFSPVDAAASLGIPPEDVDVEGLPWLSTLQDIVAAAAVQERDERSCLDSAAPFPFEDLWLPAVSVARRLLASRVGEAELDALAEAPALAACERALLGKLAHACGPAVYERFDATRPVGVGFIAQLLGGRVADASSNVHYAEFVARSLEDALLSLFAELPVMARLVAESVDHWVGATAELFERLRVDGADLRRTFGTLRGPSPPRVRSIQGNLSDLHNGGRSVLLLGFEDGLEVVYKPRSLGLEAAFNALLAWFNTKGAPLPFEVVRVLDRGTYGWMEVVAQRACASARDVELFYERAGVLLAVFHALRGTDFHLQNLIAHGAHPVPIDLETAVTHPEAERAGPGAVRAFMGSVLRTGMLPFWEVEGELAYDVSGLGSLMSTSETVERPTWSTVNTDSMTFQLATQPRTVEKNVPVLDGAPASPAEHVGRIVDGFSTMYAFLIANRDALLAPAGSLEAFAGQPARYMHRTTRTYVRLRQESQRPEFLGDSIERGLLFERLYRPLLGDKERPALWHLVEEEIAAMERLDVPYFAAQTDDDRLTLGVSAPLGSLFSGSAMEEVRASLRGLGASDLALQVGLIRGSFYAKLEPLAATEPTSLGEETLRLSNAELLDEAARIGELLLASAIRGGDGSLSWIGLTSAAGSERLGLQPIDLSLYQGTSGVALFFSALAGLTGRADFRRAARGALAPVIDLPDDREVWDEVVEHMGIGSGSGVGSMVYALVQSHRFDPEAGYLEKARRVATVLDAGVIARDVRLDVVAGAAGALLALLALHAATNDPLHLDQARACGAHLLARRSSLGASAPRAWRTAGAIPIAGFSHGAAGIAYALSRLHAATGDAAMKEAAREAIAYEGTLFSPAHGNWRYLEPGGEPNADIFRTQWCHGAPGVALGRLGVLASDDDPHVRAELAVALETTARCAISGLDHLCCGNFGRIGVLTSAAAALARSDLAAAARAQACFVVARARRAGGYRLFAELQATSYGVGLFQGMAGIGYGLLRLTDGALPDVLSFAS